ncbi:vanin-like protein 1 isoform X2 [Cardiocondyla obscurior]|uniref:vanin-like protein 1 isoform X2 n=1 Tax=Cardiocondyla obscurior TaxID=286306 RepID=UPI00396571E2
MQIFIKHEKKAKLSNMGRMWIAVYLLIVSVHLSHQKSTPDSMTYIAAVVEYPPKYFSNANETLNVNSDAYVRLIRTASLSNADIIVFPEDGLTTVNLPEREEMGDWTTIIPSPMDFYKPCTQNTIEVSNTLKKISCAARDNEIYVVINIAEKAPCNNIPCPRDKVFYYNSNVVFDRKGMIIARYRKTNLYGEHQFNVTLHPEVVSFNTDFGVKFGTFICFDILFFEPALILTRIKEITDIVYPTAWFSETPFLTAVQTQAGWSYAEDVNLLASGYNRPSFGNVGSGIYLGRKGVGKKIMPKTTHEEILIFEVPKIIKTKHNENYHDFSKSQAQRTSLDYQQKNQVNDAMITINEILLKHEDIQIYQTFLLEKSTEKSICQNNFCCEFKVEITKADPSVKYRLAVFNGARRYYLDDAYVRACGIIQCSNDSVLSCNSVQESQTVFHNIEISTTLHNNKGELIMPSTLNSDLLTLENWTFNKHAHDNHVHVNMLLNSNTNNLVTFGIYVRNFDKSNANKISFCIVNSLILTVVMLFSNL